MIESMLDVWILILDLPPRHMAPLESNAVLVEVFYHFTPTDRNQIANLAVSIFHVEQSISLHLALRSGKKPMQIPFIDDSYMQSI